MDITVAVTMVVPVVAVLEAEEAVSEVLEAEEAEAVVPEVDSRKEKK